MTPPGSQSPKVLCTTVRNSTIAVVTDLWRHIIYNLKVGACSRHTDSVKKIFD